MKKGRFGKKIIRRSGFEDKVEANLNARGIKYIYEDKNHKLEYTKLSCPHCGDAVSRGTYTCDYFIERRSGVRLLCELKGYLDSAGRTKYALIKRDNPKEDIRFLFQRNNPIRRGSKTTYGMWAEKLGFPWAVGNEIPQAWIDE